MILHVDFKLHESRNNVMCIYIPHGVCQHENEWQVLKIKYVKEMSYLVIIRHWKNVSS